MIRIQGTGIQAYSGAPSEWDREHIITSRVKLPDCSEWDIAEALRTDRRIWNLKRAFKTVCWG